ncbi:MAG: hypothetical protein OEY51_09250, partial [Cyclobacteriaceae bacterium]|nr:hypothetical protein [Cyclobacteriaceae bacterium]
MLKQTCKYLSLIGLAFLFLNLNTNAQRLKFKDIFETIAAGDYNPDIVLTQLKEYKQKEPEEGNQYYQLGRIYYERTARFDILKQNNGALQVADSAIHYLSLAKKLIDEKEVKKKDEYYREFAKNPADPKSEVTIKMVYTKIDLYINKMNEFKKNISKIYSDFNATVDNYNIANTLFTEVYGQFSTYKEMSLLAKEDFLKNLDLMKFHFDEGISYFEQYKADIKAYPIEGYKQDYKLADINNYRLHGITKANFLQNDITLWNYGKWHTDINQYLEGEVKPFRQAIIENEKALNEKLASMSKTTVPDEEEYRIASDILMLIRKYDPASFLVDIFEYKQARVNMMNSEVLSLDPIDFDKRASRYATTLYYARSGLQSLHHAEQNIADISLKRHESFLNSYYKKGVPAFITEQRKQVTPTLDYTWGELKNELVGRKEVKGAAETFGTTKDGNGQIPLFKRDPNTYLAMEKEFVTADIYQDKNFVYASGYQYVDSTRNAFVAFYRGDSLKWMMLPKVADTLQAEVLAVTSVGQGGACLMYTYSKRDKS